MTYTYEWTRKDLKNVLIKKRFKTNIIFLILGTILYFYITYYGFLNNVFDNLKLIIGFIVYFAILCLFLYFITLLYVYINLKRNDRRTKKAYGKYTITLTDEEVVSEFNGEKISYKYVDINKLKIRKKYFFISSREDKIGLTFRRDKLNEDYDKILDYIKGKINKKS